MGPFLLRKLRYGTSTDIPETLRLCLNSVIAHLFFQYIFTVDDCFTKDDMENIRRNRVVFTLKYFTV